MSFLASCFVRRPQLASNSSSARYRNNDDSPVNPETMEREPSPSKPTFSRKKLSVVVCDDDGDDDGDDVVSRPLLEENRQRINPLPEDSDKVTFTPAEGGRQAPGGTEIHAPKPDKSISFRFLDISCLCTEGHRLDGDELEKLASSDSLIPPEHFEAVLRYTKGFPPPSEGNSVPFATMQSSVWHVGAALLHLYLGSESFYSMRLYELQKMALAFDEEAYQAQKEDEQDRQDYLSRLQREEEAFSKFLSALQKYHDINGHYEVGFALISNLLFYSIIH